MKVTLISPNYFPEDTAIGLYNTDLVQFLIHNNCQLSVVTAFPYYPQWKISDSYRHKRTYLKETIQGAEVIRYKQYVPSKPTFLKRIVHIVDFTLGSYFNLKKIEGSDVVIAIVPFTSTIWLGNFLKRRHKAKLWIHVQDFEIDAAIQTGLGKKGRGAFSFLFRIEKWLFSKADMVSTISHSMMAKLEEKTAAKTFYLPNWIDENKINPERSKPHEYLKSDKIKILYSGNIGDKQDWEAFIKFCKAVDKDRYEVIVVGDGSRKEWLVDQLKPISHTSYYPPVPYAELSDLLCSADVHVLFQKTEVIDTVMPSKVLGMMASDKPSIIIGNKDSEVRSIFAACNAGFYFCEYSDQVVQSLEKLMALKEQDITNTKMTGRAYVIEHFSKDKILSKLLKRLYELSS